MIDKAVIPLVIDGDARDAAGERVGTVADIWLDVDTGEPTWVALRTGLPSNTQTFVPIASATLAEDGVHVAFPRAVLEEAPRFDAGGYLSEEREAELVEYYRAHAAAPAPAPAVAPAPAATAAGRVAPPQRRSLFRRR